MTDKDKAWSGKKEIVATMLPRRFQMDHRFSVLLWCFKIDVLVDAFIRD